MKCKKCGQELQEGENFCTKCGSKVEEVVDAENTAETTAKEEPTPIQTATNIAEEQTTKTEKKKGGKAKWIIPAIIAIIAALVVAVAVGLIYFKTDLLQSPESLFYKHLAESTKLTGKASYADVMAELQKQANASQEVAGEIKAKITSYDPDAKMVGAILEKGKITYNMKSIGGQKKMQGDITLNYDGRDVVTLNMLQNKDQYGIKVAEAYDKYVSIENNNLKAMLQKWGVDANAMPDRIEMLDYYELLNIEKEMLNHMSKTYTKALTEKIPADRYSIEKNVIVTVDGSKITTNAYKLTLTEKDVQNISINVTETLKADDKTLDLIMSKMDAIFAPYKAMGAVQVNEITKQDLLDGLDQMLQGFQSGTWTDADAMEIVVYGVKDGKSKIEVNVLDDKTTIATLNINMIKDGKVAKDTLIMTLPEDVKMEMEATVDGDKQDVQFSISADDTVISMNINGDNKSATANMKISAEGTTIELDVTSEIKAEGNSVTVEDFTSANSVKLNDMTQAELGVLVQTIQNNVMTVLPQKMQMLGIDPATL